MLTDGFFSREYVASVPAGVIAARFTSSKAGALSVSATFSRISNILTNVASTSGGANTLTLQGSSGQATANNPILFTGKAQFVASGGNKHRISYIGKTKYFNANSQGR
jgi:hypothetical protein